MRSGRAQFGLRFPRLRSHAGRLGTFVHQALSELDHSYREYNVALGLGWQRGQKWDERLMKCSRTMGVPHLRQGLSACPYACRHLSKYPDYLLFLR